MRFDRWKGNEKQKQKCYKREVISELWLLMSQKISHGKSVPTSLAANMRIWDLSLHQIYQKSWLSFFFSSSLGAKVWVWIFKISCSSMLKNLSLFFFCHNLHFVIFLIPFFNNSSWHLPDGRFPQGHTKSDLNDSSPCNMTWWHNGNTMAGTMRILI